MKILFLFPVLFTCLTLQAQSGIQWQKCLGGSKSEFTVSILPTLDGGYLLVAPSESNDGDVLFNHGSGTEDVWVVKLNSTGAIEGKTPFGGSAVGQPVSAQITNDGDFIIVANTSSNSYDVSGNHGQGDIWLVKLSSPTATNNLQEQTNWQLFPNPTTGIIEIQTDENNPLDVMLTDVFGSRLHGFQVIRNKSLDISALPNGVYFISALSKTGEMVQKKIVKQ
jgi:hypothetical protein